MSILKTEAILLSKKEIRETSAIVLFYTKDSGKVKGLIKGVRGPEAKFGLYLSEFSRFDIVYYEKKRADTFLVTQCDLLDAYTEIADDISKRLKAYYLLELVDKFTQLCDPGVEIYELLCWILEFFRKEAFTDKAVIIFELKLLQYAGFLPKLDRCVNCGAEALKEAAFSVRLSGLVCGNCRDADIQAAPLSKGAASTLNLIRKMQLKGMGRPAMANEIAKELSRMLERFIEYHLGEHLKTREVLRQVAEGIVPASTRGTVPARP